MKDFIRKFQKIRPANNSIVLTSAILFAVVAIISSFCLVTNRQIHHRLKNIAVSESEQALQQSVDTVSTSFHYIWESFTNSSLIHSFTRILTEGTGSGNPNLVYANLLSLSDELRNHFYTYAYIQDVGLFIRNGDKDYWCTTRIVSDDFRRDYDNGLFSFDEMSYDSFRDMLLNSADNRIVRQDYYVGYVQSRYSSPYSGQMLFMVYPISLNQPSLKSFAVMQIDLDRIREELTSFQYCGEYFGLYSHGRPVYATDPGMELPESDADPCFQDDSGTYYIRNFINELGLTCYLSLDSNKIYQGISPFSRLLGILFFILAATGLLFVCFLFYYWLIPILKISLSLPSSSGERNAVARISHHLTELSTQNAEAADQLLHYQKSLALKKIYLGQASFPADHSALADFVPVEEVNFRCICIGCLKEKAVHLFDPESIIGQLRKVSLTAAAYTVIDDIFTCLILQSDNHVYADSQVFFGSLNDLLSALNEENSGQFAIGISDVYNSADSIPQAYQEARKSWQSAFFWQNAAVVFNTSLSQYSSSYFVSYDQLDSLYQAIVTNHKDTALKIFDQLVAENFENSKSGRQRALYCQQFTTDILGVLVRISTQFDIYAVVESYMSMNAQTSLQRRISLLREAIIESCEFIPIHDYDTDLINAILKYCDEHYADYQLSLSSLADQFHLSKSSISKYFKANSGVNFSAYIEKLRIQQAEKLIMEKKLSIREIAEEVGYQNITTFYNAFRKIEKCTPTEWRQQKEILERY